MKYIIANDHGGIDLVDSVEEKLLELGHEVEKVGTFTKDSCDYSDFAKIACEKVLNKKADFAILICGTGIGMSLAANKFKGIRAACLSDVYPAKMCRAHNNSNVLCIGSRVIGSELAKMIVEVFSKTEFEGGRHLGRINKIKEIEENN